MKLIFKIAKSLLLARLKQTTVAAIGVTFSITMFIALLGFMTGLNDLLDGLILNRTAHVRLFKEIKPSENQPIDISKKYLASYNFVSSVKSGSNRKEIFNSGPIINAIKKDNRVLGVGPKIIAPVFFNDGAIEINGSINGIDVDVESKLFFFDDYITSGKSASLKNVSNSIILGKGLADKLLANIGDVVVVTTAQGERFSLKVVGYFQSGIMELDKVQSYASIATTQKLLGKSNNYITDIQIKLKNIERAPAVAKEYANIFQVDAEDIQTANAQFETGSNVRNIISYAVGITLLVVAGFGIYNILNMMIFEKMDSIAILKATGFSGKDVKQIFTVIALSIGIVGGLFGLLFGFFLSLGIDQIPFKTASLPTVKTYPINYSAVFYIIGGIFSLITTYLAGYFPAKKASKIDPVEIIRGK
ncbi:MAG: ABC transporter permease [Bacteroidota bacterium]|nr:ABC transporter permease [Bacteroidota bacterium]MDP3143805.1 ABC transporter permease [Bacteroidota bacterium]